MSEPKKEIVNVTEEKEFVYRPPCGHLYYSHIQIGDLYQCKKCGKKTPKASVQVTERILYRFSCPSCGTLHHVPSHALTSGRDGAKYLKCSAFCNNLVIRFNEETGKWERGYFNYDRDWVTPGTE